MMYIQTGCAVSCLCAGVLSHVASSHFATVNVCSHGLVTHSSPVTCHDLTRLRVKKKPRNPVLNTTCCASWWQRTVQRERGARGKWGGLVCWIFGSSWLINGSIILNDIYICIYILLTRMMDQGSITWI
jgi:hypothetical protein